MNKTITLFILSAVLYSLTALFSPSAFAHFIGAKRVHCCPTCCPQGSGDGTGLTGVGSDMSGPWGFVSYSEGLYGDTAGIVNAPGANGEGLEFSLHYASYNANGNNASLDTGLGYGWSHSYNIYLFSQNLSLFKMSPGGIVSKYQRSGRTGALSAITGTQQTIVQNADGSIDISNRLGGTRYRFENIAANPLRVAAVAPMMLTTITDRNGNITRLSYQNGLLAQVKDTYGRQIKFQYDANNHLIKVTDPLNRVTQLAYTGYGNLAMLTDPLGNTVQYSYDVRHQIIGKTDKNGRQWSYRYDAGGNPLAVTDQAGNPLLTMVNSNGWATNATDLAVSQLRTYIPAVTTLTDGRGNQWQYFYNADGQISKTIAPDNAVTSYAYDPATLNMAGMTDANGHATLYQYDSFGNMLTQIDAIGNQTRYQYGNSFNFVTQAAYYAAGVGTPH